MARNILAWLQAASVEHGERTAMMDPAGMPVSFRTFHVMILSFADRLEAKGVRAGDVVQVRAADWIANTLVRLAVMHLGATATHVPLEALAAHQAPQPRWRVGTPDQATPEDEGRYLTLDASWIVPPRRLLPLVPGGAFIRSTSGTTGLPKLRLITAEGLTARLEHSMSERDFVPGPTFIGYRPTSSPGTNHIVRMLVEGHFQMHPQTTPELSLELMERHGITKILAPPRVVEQLAHAAESTGLRPSALRQIAVGGSSISEQLAARAEALFGCAVWNSFGSHETGSISFYRPTDPARLPGSVGRIQTQFRTRFTREDGSPAPADEGGELWLQVAPENRLTDYPSGRSLSDSEGWVATGDVGRILQDGTFQLLGRRSDFLNVGGNKVAPVHFEAIAREHTGVLDVVVFCAPVASGSDEVGIAVRPRESFDLGTFCQHMASHLGPEFPFHVAVLPELPVTPAGKPDRRGLTLAFAEWQGTLAAPHAQNI
ncbi:fatty acid--CoA ligase family protein [Sedimentimonas flavescens]|uniref:Fatty acid--CoA ligase family protein n=1 Tax=Sedimentimonas flavescens TaxID=2851012 RepID=A0ABT3A1E4_9RHOB|nr:fatty acid--CoA ligase family protein [Sedimentimonas flavescens]MCV2879405.1 fatty acid--CoA ligase family protein [Sedimentimonas flavescens]